MPGNMQSEAREVEQNVRKERLAEEESEAIKPGLKQVDEIDELTLQTSIDKVNQYAEVQGVDLALKLDEDLGRVVVKVLDRETDEVIKQLPSEHAVALSKRIDEMMQEFFDGDADRALNLINDNV